MIKTRFDLKESCVGCENLDLKSDILLKMETGYGSYYQLYLMCSHSNRCPIFIQCENFIQTEV